jgi:hypothetical protein
MARGKSGRIVLEIDAELKRKLYSVLENEQQTMKEWFVKEAEVFIYEHNHPFLFNDHIDHKMEKRKAEGERT